MDGQQGAHFGKDRIFFGAGCAQPGRPLKLLLVALSATQYISLSVCVCVCLFVCSFVRHTFTNMTTRTLSVGH